MSRWAEDRAANVEAAFNRLTPSEKADLILHAPDLYFAVARFVRTREASR